MDNRMYPRQTKYKEFFSQTYETKLGEEHPFLGFSLNRTDAESLHSMPIYKKFLPSDSIHPVHLTVGNILCIPELTDETDIFYIQNTFGSHGMFSCEIVSTENILTGDKYILKFSDPLADPGVYESLTTQQTGTEEETEEKNYNKGRITDLPPMAPISDYYIGQQINRSEEVLPELL